MYYLIDGYNLLFFQLQPGENLQKQRDLLIEKLAKYAERLKWNVMIVFDSQYQCTEGSLNHFKNLIVCFTRYNETADEFIVNKVRHEKKPSQVTVVTSDQKLSWYCRIESAQTMSVREFTNQLSRQYKNKQKAEIKPLKKGSVSTLQKRTIDRTRENAKKEAQEKENNERENPGKENPKRENLLKNPKNSVESCFQAYLKIFEENSHCEISQKGSKGLSQKLQKDDLPPIESDFQRWLRIFGSGKEDEE